MNDEKILDILIDQLDILYKEYLHYKEVGSYDLVMIYSEKMRTVMCLSACFGLWDKLKPIVSVCYKI